ncbi:MAG: rhodanese-like domain-containing protein [Chloroflexota bacterium]
MTITKGCKQLVAEAEEVIRTYPIEEAVALAGSQDVVFVDIRDVRELEKTGKVAGAVHAPRGMLEFWFDPESPYYREIFGSEDKSYVLYCASGWRSALATKTLYEMGMSNVGHIGGGFTAWKEANGPLEEYKHKAAKAD